MRDRSRAARVFAPCAGFVFALVFAAQTASAAQVTQIEFSVTGGSFGGSLASGSITGGRVVYTPATTLSTPTSAAGGSLFLSLTGSSGFFSLYAFSGIFAVVNPTVAQISLANVTSLSGVSGAGSVVSVLRAGLNLPSLLAGYVRGSAYGTTYQPFDHVFTIGNEVRTVVPEPASAGLVGLGLVGLGLAAGGRRAARRRGDRS